MLNDNHINKPTSAETGTLGEITTRHANVVLHAIFESMRDGVNIVDEKGILTYCNPSSAHYVNTTPNEMIGRPIGDFYPKAALLNVIKTKKVYFDERVFDGRSFNVNALPLFIDGSFRGGIATFREITDIIKLTNKLATMEEQINSMQLELTLTRHSDVFKPLVGCDGSLKQTIEKAQRCIAALGGPRHSIIAGETGTGKTTLAKAMCNFARKINVISRDAPFIEVNCAQFTNSDIAAVEIFGSEKGSFTGALDRKGLIELADGGILFLDEAHELGPYQTMLLKVIEEGLLRRIGGRSDKKINVIIIAASTRNLKEVLLPELYQRLAQYQIFLPPLREKPLNEKKAMMQAFCRQYEQSAKEHYKVDLKVSITPTAENILLSGYYPRNIRQFRDIVNSSIDAAVPPIFSIREECGPVLGVVDIDHLPNDVYELDENTIPAPISEQPATQDNSIAQRIASLSIQGLGPRRIAKMMQAAGINIEYYQVAYRLKKLKEDTKA